MRIILIGVRVWVRVRVKVRAEAARQGRRGGRGGRITARERAGLLGELVNERDHIEL